MGGRPGDRPRGAPTSARPALVAWYLLVGSTVTNIASLAPFATGAEHGSYLIVGVIIASLLILLPVGGMGQGKLWAVRAFRFGAYATLACYPPILAAAFYLFFGEAPRLQDPTAPDMAVIQFIFCALELIAFFILFRALRQVRWLDPNSLPHEWEPPSGPIRYP